MQRMTEYAWAGGRPRQWAFHKLNGSVRRKNGQISRYLPPVSRAKAGVADVITQIELAPFFEPSLMLRPWHENPNAFHPPRPRRSSHARIVNDARSVGCTLSGRLLQRS